MSEIEHFMGNMPVRCSIIEHPENPDDRRFFYLVTAFPGTEVEGIITQGFTSNREDVMEQFEPFIPKPRNVDSGRSGTVEPTEVTASSAPSGLPLTPEDQWHIDNPNADREGMFAEESSETHEFLNHQGIGGGPAPYAFSTTACSCGGKWRAYGPNPPARDDDPIFALYPEGKPTLPWSHYDADGNLAPVETQSVEAKQVDTRLNRPLVCPTCHGLRTVRIWTQTMDVAAGHAQAHFRDEPCPDCSDEPA